MTKATICDRCDVRIDKGWNGVPLTVKNSTGTGGPSAIHLCLDCHTDIRGKLYPILLDGESGYEHKPGTMLDDDPNA